MTSRWVLFGILGIFFLGNAIANASMFYRFFVHRKRGSAIPLLGALSGTFAILVVPIDGAHAWWWLPWVVDPGGLFWCGMVIYRFLRTRTIEQ